MLARDYCDASKKKFKPVILSHHMLYGLQAGQEKMSKSNPDSAIFMEDTVEDVRRKIMNAYCPTEPAKKAEKAEVTDAGKESMSLVEDDLKNPCLDYTKYIVFRPPGATFTTKSKTYTDFEDVKADFLSGALKEAEFKEALIDALNALLEPVRKHFSENDVARDLLAKVREYVQAKRAQRRAPHEAHASELCHMKRALPHEPGRPRRHQCDLAGTSATSPAAGGVRGVSPRQPPSETARFRRRSTRFLRSLAQQPASDTPWLRSPAPAAEARAFFSLRSIRSLSSSSSWARLHEGAPN
jgi:hypothetical protein